jgi:hypothetical protein
MFTSHRSQCPCSHHKPKEAETDPLKPTMCSHQAHTAALAPPTIFEIAVEAAARVPSPTATATSGSTTCQASIMCTTSICRCSHSGVCTDASYKPRWVATPAVARGEEGGALRKHSRELPQPTTVVAVIERGAHRSHSDKSTMVVECGALHANAKAGPRRQ